MNIDSGDDESGDLACARWEYEAAVGRSLRMMKCISEWVNGE